MLARSPIAVQVLKFGDRNGLAAKLSAMLIAVSDHELGAESFAHFGGAVQTGRLAKGSVIRQGSNDQPDYAADEAQPLPCRASPLAAYRDAPRLGLAATPAHGIWTGRRMAPFPLLVSLALPAVFIVKSGQ